MNDGTKFRSYTTGSMVQVLGTCDDFTTCECCGRTNLKVTVALDFGEGNVLRYGRDCAARATGRRVSAIESCRVTADSRKARRLTAEDRRMRQLEEEYIYAPVAV
jgi:hypothetical protein